MLISDRVQALAPRAAVPAHHRFRVAATAEPGVLPRALELFAKRGLVPAETHAVTRPADGPGEPRLVLELSVAGLEPGAADHVAACLRQLVAVDSVLHWAD